MLAHRWRETIGERWITCEGALNADVSNGDIGEELFDVYAGHVERTSEDRLSNKASMHQETACVEASPNRYLVC